MAREESLVDTRALRFSRGFFMALYQPLDDRSLLHQPVACGNHPLWLAGHLACVDEFFRTSVGGGDPILPVAWNTLFGPGSTPRRDRGAYPARTEVDQGLAAARTALLEWFESCDDYRARQLLPENLRSFARSVELLPGSLAVHEGLHTGQLSVVRKSLGLAPAIM